MDIRTVLYYLFIGIGAVLSAVSGYYFGKKQGIPVSTLKIYIPYGIMTGLIGAMLMSYIQTFIMSFTPFEYAVSRFRIFGGLLFLPLFMYFPVKYLGGDYDTVTDAFAPGAYLLSGIAKIGCAAYGCCYGIEFSHGISSRFTDYPVFPVQILESVLSVFITFILFMYLKKKNRRKGTAYPLSLILYGVMRFFCEYLRYYPEAEKSYFFGMNFWQMFSVIATVAGILWLTYACVKSRESKSLLPRCGE